MTHPREQRQTAPSGRAGNSAALFDVPRTRKDKDKETKIRPDIGLSPPQAGPEPGKAVTRQTATWTPQVDAHVTAETPKPPGGLINCHSSSPPCPRFNEPHADNLRLQQGESPDDSRAHLQPSNGGGGLILMRQEAEKGTKMCVGNRKDGFGRCRSSSFSSDFEGIGSFHLANI